MAESDAGALKTYGVLAIAGFGVIGAGGWMHYNHPPALPPPPPVEKKPEAPQLAVAVNSTLDGYRAILSEDGKKFGVGATLPTMVDVMPYKVEYEGSRRLIGKDSLSTEHLEIQARIEKQWLTIEGNQRMGADTFMLYIKNKSSRYVAYRIETEVSDSGPCRSKGITPQNAIALRPQEEISRAECLWSRGFFIFVKRVEVMEIPALSYYYLSRLHPPHVLYSERTSSGHQPPMGKPCEMVPWRDIQAGAEAGEVAWSDIIDFYARHNCEEYSFFRGYKRRTKRSEELPALPAAIQK